MSVTSKLMEMAAAGAGGGGKTLLLAANNALVALDVSDPASISVLSSVTGTNSAVGSVALDTVNMNAYSSYGTDSFRSFDISDVSSMALLNTVTNATAFNAPRGNAIDVSRAVAFTAVYQTPGKLTSIDVSNPSSMSILGTYSDSTAVSMSSVAIDTTNNVAYVGCQNRYIVAVNISNPSSMTLLGRLELPFGFENIFSVSLDTSRDIAFVTTSTGDALFAINIANPTSMSVIGSYANAAISQAYDVAHDPVSQIAYVAGRTANGIAAIDTSSPASMSLIGSISNATTMALAQGVDVDVEAGLAYVTGYSSDSVTVIDVSNPASMVELGSTYGTMFLNNATSPNLLVGGLSPANAWS